MFYGYMDTGNEDFREEEMMLFPTEADRQAAIDRAREITDGDVAVLPWPSTTDLANKIIGKGDDEALSALIRRCEALEEKAARYATQLGRDISKGF